MSWVNNQTSSVREEFVRVFARSATAAPRTLAALNARWPCPDCGARDAWVQSARPVIRHNSIIERFSCRRCGGAIAAKSVGTEAGDTQAQLRTEYDALSMLFTGFPQDEEFATLEPLGFIETPDASIMLTRWVAGDQLDRYARALKIPQLALVFEQAGTWLRKFHRVDGGALRDGLLGVGEKLTDIETTYGRVLGRYSDSCKAYAMLKATAADIEVRTSNRVHLHGDFKPENLLYDGRRCTGIDISWRITAAPVFDLAPFLNHLWLSGLGRGAGTRKARYVVAERAFLRGYGWAGDGYTLRWAQLYFALCYLARYRQHGTRASIYARFVLGPLVRKVARNLSEVI